MRIPANLASEPFRRDRPMVVGSAVVGVLLAGLLVMLTFLALGERDRASESRQILERMEKQVATMATEQNRLEAILLRPENAEVLARSQFINELLIRKGVSWTRIFADLEKVTPHNVRLMQVRPQVSGQNDMFLDMTVASQTVEPVTTFLMQLETSPVFGVTTLHNWVPPSQTDPLYRYRVSVSYAQKL
jgi:type IV pilus assembly protein PilN